MKKETELFYEICSREREEISLSDARPSMLGGSFKQMNNLSEMKYYLDYCNETTRLKKELRKEVGWVKYYFCYMFKFINSYNSHYYWRP